MAITITWEFDIIPISYSDKTASIQATRTEIDDVALTTLINTYNVAKTTIDTITMANNIPILDEIWEKHQARLSGISAKETFVSDLELLGKTNLEARE